MQSGPERLGIRNNENNFNSATSALIIRVITQVLTSQPDKTQAQIARSIKEDLEDGLVQKLMDDRTEGLYTADPIHAYQILNTLSEALSGKSSSTPLRFPRGH